MITDKDRVVNTLIQMRVSYDRCIDCGMPLTGYKGYCKDGRCGHIKNRIRYTNDELEIAQEVRNHKM